MMRVLCFCLFSLFPPPNPKRSPVMTRLLTLALTALMLGATAADAAVITLTTRALQRRAQRQERVQIGLRMMEGGTEARASVDVLAIREWMRGDLDEPFFNWRVITLGAVETVGWLWLLDRADALPTSNRNNTPGGTHIEQNVTVQIDSGNTTTTDNSQRR